MRFFPGTPSGPVVVFVFLVAIRGLLGVPGVVVEKPLQVPSDLFEKARRAERVGHLKEAESLYLCFLKLVPDSAEGHANLGVVYSHEAKFAEAIGEYSQALKLNSSLTGVYLNLGIAYYREERFNQALKFLEAFGSREPENPQARKLLGLCDLEVGRYEEAIHVLAPFRSEGDPMVLFALGATYMRVGRMAEAEQVFKTLLSADPDSPRLHFFLGQAYVGMAQYSQALSEFEKVYSQDPKFPRIHFFLGGALLKLGRMEEAESQFRQELTVNTRYFAANLALGTLLNKQGRYSEALPLLERAAETAPQNTEALLELARARWKRGEIRAAFNTAQRAVREATESRRAHFLLAEIAREAGDKATARKEFAMAASLSEKEAEQDIVRLARRFAPNARPPGSQGFAPGEAHDEQKTRTRAKTKERTKTGARTKAKKERKGDTSNEVRVGTFLKSFDTAALMSLIGPKSVYTG